MLSKEDNKKSLVIGIGNPLRSDDGVGPYIVEHINALKLPLVKTLIVQQLNIELLEEIVRFHRILLVDASFLGEGLIFKKVQSSDASNGSSSHHVTPEFLWSLAAKLYHVPLNLYLCAIRGRNFEMGQDLSPEVKMIVPQAMEEIKAFLKEK